MKNIFVQNKKNFLVIIIMAGILSIGISYAVPLVQTGGTAQDVAIGNGNKLYLDGGTNSYLTSPSSGQVAIFSGGTQTLTANNGQVNLNEQFLSSVQTYNPATQSIFNDYNIGAPSYLRYLDIVADSANTASSMRFFTFPSGGSAPVERMRIDSSGNAEFDNQIILNEQSLSSAQTYGPLIQSILNDYNIGAPSYLRYLDIVAGSPNTASTMRFFTFPSSGSGEVEQMRITGSGNVGIGTTIPAQKLEVNGNIEADGNYTTASTNKELKISAPSGVPICIGTGC